jgi:hypothetical protein
MGQTGSTQLNVVRGQCSTVALQDPVETGASMVNPSMRCACTSGSCEGADITFTPREGLHGRTAINAESPVIFDF